MSVTDRDFAILRHLRRYFFLRAAQIRDLVAPHDHDGSIARGRLRKLVQAGLIRRYQPKMVDFNGSVAPIFALTMKGANLLVTATGDCSLWLTVEPTFADWMGMNHYCALSALHMKIDAAMQAQSRVTMHALFFEHEVIQSGAAQPDQKYRLYSVVSQAPRIVCCPDSAFETEVAGYRRAWYVEREMGTDTPARVAAKKHKGYEGLARLGLFRRHFPHARDFRVLAFCPNAAWRDRLRKEMKSLPGAELWSFAASPDVSEETFLHQPLFYTVDRGPLPLIPRPAGSPAEGAEPEKLMEKAVIH